MRLSVTARIALLSVALAILSNLAVLGVVRQQTRTDALAELRRETVADLDSLTAAWRSGGEKAVRDTIADAADPTDDDAALALFDARGLRLAGTGPDRLAIPMTAARFKTGVLASDGDWSDDAAGYVLRAAGDRWVLAARRLTIIEDQQRGLERALLVGVIVALALGGLGGLIVSRYVARRLDRIAGVIDAAGEGDLSRRVERTAGGDAFDRLGGRLNATLDRIERLMTELRVVTDGLAHDLRSPLARLRSRTEQAVLLPDGAARDAALGGLLVETDQVMRMLTMLIEISKAEQVARSRFALVNLGGLLGEIADLYGPLLDDADVSFTIEVQPGVRPIAVHRELLSQAITNLIDNALKYGKGAAIVLGLFDAGDTLAINVSDGGPGIAEDDRADALRRFGRLDAARTTPGAGLGMALVEAVARLHGGELILADNAPGLIARIMLPREEPRA
jgi:signal transduction histidine kinase